LIIGRLQATFTDFPENRNKSGFSALQGGWNMGSYGFIGRKGSWWSSEEENTVRARGRSLDYSSGA
jgi:hypothetical protein